MMKLKNLVHTGRETLLSKTGAPMTSAECEVITGGGALWTKHPVGLWDWAPGQGPEDESEIMQLITEQSAYDYKLIAREETRIWWIKLLTNRLYGILHVLKQASRIPSSQGGSNGNRLRSVKLKPRIITDSERCLHVLPAGINRGIFDRDAKSKTDFLDPYRSRVTPTAINDQCVYGLSEVKVVDRLLTSYEKYDDVLSLKDFTRL